MKKSGILSGALILSIGGVVAKVFSAVYRIALTRILGGVGIGIYQLIFPFYSLCVVLATAGLPMAISKVISKNKGNEVGVLKKCFLFTFLISLFLTFLLLVSSKGLAILQGQRDISVCYIILAPTILFVGASSVLRGYFQGKHNFTPSAVSNIVEQFVKLVAGLVLCVSLVGVGLIVAIIGAIIGIVLSEIISLVILLVYIKKEKLKLKQQTSVSLKDLVKDIIPITLTNLVLPISSFIDSVLVINLLANSFSNEVSVFLYGLESGAVSSLVSLPTIFSFAIASVILPNIANAGHFFNKNQKLNFAIKIVLIITLPCVLCFALVPNRLIGCLYGNRLSGCGINGVDIASRLLAWSGFGIIFMAINQIYSSCLQAVDERYVAIRNLIIGVVLKFIIQLIFMPCKFLNIYTLAIANTVCYITVMVLNHFEIKENFSLKIDYIFFSKLIFANVIMIVSLVAVMSLNFSVANTMIAAVLAITVYFLALIFINIFSKKEKAMLKYKV